MPIEPGLIGYAALASLTLGMKKHRPTPPLPLMPSPQSARLLGWLLIACAAVIAILRFGPALGIVAWTGQLCLGGAALVLLLSWRPRVALLLAAPALGLALASAMA